ncbi:carbamate kinase [Pseudidiomarina insulisalsae]|uniref:Carbamate kinase n=1 Tax=Pseudidiomarina insulisalsae TaxID=575789 RepID=A0A432YCJ2_9GAMM|nr:carbamate kinase [Pseudidiomarina insulisalsae]RUO58720.1 carbamate kinase [Pseudidiomarina insulisalsae]
MRVVAALGGNAVSPRGEKLTAEKQRENIKGAVQALVKIVRAGHDLVITHGNGPQIGLLALQNDAYDRNNSFPLDILGAESEGMIGYMLEQELESELGEEPEVATVLTQIAVVEDDPAFADPHKFVGPVYDEEQAQQLKDERGWSIAKDGDKWRRVVPSPAPQKILDLKVLQLLVAHKIIPICIGGGGIPVVQHSDGSYHGVEAVIDKDAASALLARQLDADALLLLTDVAAVYENYGSSEQKAIAHMTVAKAQNFDAPAGSMGPKIQAAAEFAQHGDFSVIGCLDDALAMLEHRAGTCIR